MTETCCIHNFQAIQGADEIMTNPIIVPGHQGGTDGQLRIATIGQSFDIHEWS
jgi:hypothetical protein